MIKELDADSFVSFSVFLEKKDENISFKSGYITEVHYNEMFYVLKYKNKCIFQTADSIDEEDFNEFKNFIKNHTVLKKYLEEYLNLYNTSK